MILLLATASLRDKNTMLMKEATSWRENPSAACNFLTSSVSFVLDFSRASTLAWRLLTDALQSETSR